MTTNQKISIFGIISVIILFFLYNFYFSPSAICINTYKEATIINAKEKYSSKKQREEYIENQMIRSKVVCTKPKS
mgnify:CR=1 FL=1